MWPKSSVANGSSIVPVPSRTAVSPPYPGYSRHGDEHRTAPRRAAPRPAGQLPEARPERVAVGAGAATLDTHGPEPEVRREEREREPGRLVREVAVRRCRRSRHRHAGADLGGAVRQCRAHRAKCATGVGPGLCWIATSAIPSSAIANTPRPARLRAATRTRRCGSPSAGAATGLGPECWLECRRPRRGRAHCAGSCRTRRSLYRRFVAGYDRAVSDPLFDLSGRVAVVTGGMGQLGAELSVALAGAEHARRDPRPRDRRRARGRRASRRRSTTARSARTRATSPTARRSRRRSRSSRSTGASRTCSSTRRRSTRRPTHRRRRSGRSRTCRSSRSSGSSTSTCSGSSSRAR